MVAELRDTFADLRDRPRRCAAVVVAGRGKGFCAGANMTGDDVTPPEAQDRGPVGADPLHPGQPRPADAGDPRAAPAGHRRGARRRRRRRPRRSRSSCDLRVASDDASFGAQFIRVGLSACDVGSSYWLPRVVGPTIAAELMLTGRRFSAEEALRFGMLNRVVDARRAARRRGRAGRARSPPTASTACT